MDKNTPEQQANALLYQLEIGRKQLEQLTKQEQMIQGALMEMESTLEALDALKARNPGDEIMLQVGSGAFMKAKLTDTQNVMVGIGAGLSVEKKIGDAIFTMKARTESLNDSMKNVRKSMGELTMKIAELNMRAQKMMGSLE
jgi:prefoldin alpha subunit